VFRGELRRCPLDGTELHPLPRDPQLGAHVASRYAIKSVLGDSTLGRIYYARALADNSEWAVHVLYGEHAASGEQTGLFASHVERWSGVAHPHLIVPTEAGVTVTGLPFLVTPLVAGRTAADLIREDAPLNVRRATGLVRDIAAAAQALHGAGLVHGDLTPEHVVVTPEDPERAIVELPRPGNVLGTVPYRPPEQGKHWIPDARSDLYSIGVLFYELLSGAVPFSGSRLAQVLDSQSRPAPAIADRVPGLRVDPLAESVALRLLAADPERRFQTSADLLNALDYEV